MGEGREGQKSIASSPGYASLSYSENVRKGHYSGLKGLCERPLPGELEQGLPGDPQGQVTPWVPDWVGASSRCLTHFVTHWKRLCLPWVCSPYLSITRLLFLLTQGEGSCLSSPTSPSLGPLELGLCVLAASHLWAFVLVIPVSQVAFLCHFILGICPPILTRGTPCLQPVGGLSQGLGTHLPWRQAGDGLR